MTISSAAAAQRLCEASDWTLTQLSVHKGLYLAHMTLLGKTRGSNPLVNEEFQAWDYGPVLPSLYQDLKMFGRKPVKNIFWRSSSETNVEENNVIDDIAKQIRSIRPSALVHFTHHEDGAWAKHYQPGGRGIAIPNKDILDEYDWRPKTA